MYCSGSGEEAGTHERRVKFGFGDFDFSYSKADDTGQNRYKNWQCDFGWYDGIR